MNLGREEKRKFRELFRERERVREREKSEREKGRRGQVERQPAATHDGCTS